MIGVWAFFLASAVEMVFIYFLLPKMPDFPRKDMCKRWAFVPVVVFILLLFYSSIDTGKLMAALGIKWFLVSWWMVYWISFSIFFLWARSGGYLIGLIMPMYLRKRNLNDIAVQIEETWNRDKVFRNSRAGKVIMTSLYFLMLGLFIISIYLAFSFGKFDMGLQ